MSPRKRREPLTFFVPDLPDMRLSKNGRLHFLSRGNAFHDELIKTTGAILEVWGRPSSDLPCYDHAGVVYRYNFGDKRRRDAGNVSTAYAAWTDALVRLGIIPDDNDRVLRYEYAMLDEEMERGTRVEVKEL